MMFKLVSALAILNLTAGVSAAVGAYGKCGGADYTGETDCVAGYVCTYSNDFYSQCIPGTAATTSASTTLKTTTSSTTTSKTTTAVTSATTSKTTTPVTTSSTTKVSTTLVTSSTTKSTTPVVTTTTSKSTTLSTTTTTVVASPTNAIFVAVDGSDSGSGSITSPLKSIQSAVNLATPGKTIYLRGGTYALSKNINFAKSGTAALPYTVSAYGSEKVILDGEGMVGTPAALNAALDNADRGIFHIQNANYWRFIALEFINGPYGVYARDASNNYYERLITRNNYESGFQLEGASANNQVLYLDSYGNRDPRKNGESADGFACKSGSGTGNILKGARLWNNVDDGLDLWDFGSAVTVEDTISWGNGYNRWGFSSFAGDGNGFKLGSKDLRYGPHIIKNCISFLNAVDGFVDNGNTQPMTLTRNTAFNNGRQGYRFGSSTSKFVSNIAASNINAPYLFGITQTQTGNSWNVGGTWNNATFISVSASIMAGPRQADGKIVGSGFLLPVSGAAIGATTYWV